MRRSLFNVKFFDSHLDRKDYYGVYAEPVDPEEVCREFLSDVNLLEFLNWLMAVVGV